MLDNISLGRYYPKDSFIHKLNPVFKVISLLIMIVSIFFIDSYADIIMLISYLLLTLSYSDISIKVYLKNIYNIKVFLLFILIINLIFFKGINQIVFDLFKIIFILMYSSVLTYTTAMTEINYGVYYILKPLNRMIPINDISMVITLALRYIPTLMDEASRIVRAQKVRGINFDTKNIKEKISNIYSVFIPMFVISIKKAFDIADIMDIRLYNYGRSRTNYRLNKWIWVDTLLLILNITILIIVIIY